MLQVEPDLLHMVLLLITPPMPADDNCGMLDSTEAELRRIASG